MAISHSPRIVRDGLVLALDAADRNSYPGSGTTWYDLSGNTINGTLVNSPTFDSSNAGNISFDGTNESISIPETSALNIIDYTYAFWIKRVVGQSASWIQFLQRSTSSRNPGIWFYINEVNRIHFSILVSNGSLPSVNPSGFLQNEWHYFTATVEYTGGNTVMKGYSDGVVTSSNTINSVSPSLGTGTSYVGKQLMNLADLKIYNRALSAQEVLQNYNATKTRFGL